MDRQSIGFNVAGEIRDGVRIITISYDEDSFLHEVESRQLSSAIQKEYKRHHEPILPSCVAVLRARAAGSAVAFALYELYKECSRGGGHLYIVGYPKDYIQTIATLGLTTLRDFELIDTVDTALSKIKAAS